MRPKLAACVVLLCLAGALAACQSPSAQGPSVWLDRPLDGEQLPLEPLTIQSHASSAEGVARFEFFIGDAPLAVLPANNVRFAEARAGWSPAAPGTYTVRARAVDAAGRAGADAVARVIIGQAVSPTFTATPTAPTAAATFTATPTAPTATATPTTTPTAPTATATPTATPAAPTATAPPPLRRPRRPLPRRRPHRRRPLPRRPPLPTPTATATAPRRRPPPPPAGRRSRPRPGAPGSSSSPTAIPCDRASARGCTGPSPAGSASPWMGRRSRGRARPRSARPGRRPTGSAWTRATS